MRCVGGDMIAFVQLLMPTVIRSAAGLRLRA